MPLLHVFTDNVVSSGQGQLKEDIFLYFHFASWFDVWIHQKFCSGQFRLRQSEFVNINQEVGVMTRCWNIHNIATVSVSRYAKNAACMISPIVWDKGEMYPNISGRPPNSIYHQEKDVEDTFFSPLTNLLEVTTTSNFSDLDKVKLLMDWEIDTGWIIHSHGKISPCNDVCKVSVFCVVCELPVAGVSLNISHQARQPGPDPSPALSPDTGPACSHTAHWQRKWGEADNLGERN